MSRDPAKAAARAALQNERTKAHEKELDQDLVDALLYYAEASQAKQVHMSDEIEKLLQTKAGSGYMDVRRVAAKVLRILADELPQA